jgi:HK97 family phage major capsid protein
MFDYRELQGRADLLQKQVEELTAKEEPTAADRDKIMGLMGEIRALEDTAGDLRDAEVKELREIVARSGSAVVLDPQAQEVADFKNYLKTGEIKNASMTTTDANGGFLVPEPKHAELMEFVRKNNPIFGLATKFDLVGGDATIYLPMKVTHGVVAAAAETGARSEQNAPTFEGPTLTCYEYYTDQRATQKTLDSIAGIEDQLVEWIYGDIFEQAEYDAAVGNGSTKIKGLFAHVTGSTPDYPIDLSATADALNNTCWLTTYFKLPIKYRRNAVWMMAPATLGVAAAYADPASASIKLATLVNDQWMIYGKRVVECDSAPAIGNGLFPVAFGDIAQAYAVAVHRTPTVLRDPYTAKPYVSFYGLGRLGGVAWNHEALRLIKSDNA